MAQRSTRLTQEEFISRARQVWGDRFDFSKAIYKNNHTKVEVVCEKHGSFFATPSNIYAGWGCKQCGIEEGARKRSINTAEFLERAKAVHGDTYDLSKVDYVRNDVPITVICRKHGEFYPTPSNFLKGSGCKACGYERNAKNNARTTQEFIEDAIRIHGDRYDYSLVEYEGCRKDVKIICKEHGVFEQSPMSHLKGSDCPECAKTKGKQCISNEEFIRRAKEAHGDKYDYSLCEYKRNNKPVKIICRKHGVFEIRAFDHLRNNGGCKECKKERIGELQRLTTDEFIAKSKSVHGNIYDYSKVEYVDAYTPVKLVCSKHGEFEQRAYAHIHGQGCPCCKTSTGEEKVLKFLQENNIEFVKEKTFPDCKYINPLRFDFYLPEYNICIEYQGMQHYKPLEIFGGNDAFEIRVKRDNIKREYCTRNNINLMEIRYDEDVETKLQTTLNL